MESPRDYGLPHDDWRPGQHPTIQKVLRMDNGEVKFLEAPTGSGKTAIAGAVGSQFSVTALCRTKVLQAENYDRGYKFDALFGRGNYPCYRDPLLTGAECEFAEIGMHKCPDSGECEYLQQKELVKASNRRSLNYAYWLVAKWPRQTPTDFVFCDEAHLLSEVILDFAGCTITEKQRRRWDLSPFPRISDTRGILSHGNPAGDALEWLQNARVKLLFTYKSLSQNKSDPKVIKQLRACERFGMKLRSTIGALRQSGEDWYIVSGPGARREKGNRVPGFVCKPLTARHHAPRYFLDGWHSVMMSATIGDADTFARELGIAEYGGIRVGSAWGPEVRPVLVPRDAPALGRSAKVEDYERQAEMINDLVRGVDPGWCGVIHQTSIHQANQLAGRLANLGLFDRVWLPPRGKGTEAQMEAWEVRKAQVPNSLAITWSWQTGVDLLREKIDIVAKVPFPSLASGYERARMKFDGKFYQQRSAWGLEQACGRTRRGRPQDYDLDGQVNGLVAIVDNNWRRVKGKLSQGFKDALVEV